MYRLFVLLLLLMVSKGFSQKSLQLYTPSVLYDKGKWELKSFQNLYTQTQVFTNGGRSTTGNRQTWFTSINQFLYGVNSRINVGADIWGKYVKYDNLDLTRVGIVGLGPKIKVLPFEKLSGLSVQSTLLLPFTSDLESNEFNNQNKPFLDKDRIFWINEVFYDKVFANNLQLLTRVGIWYSFAGNSFRSNNYLETPLSMFLSYLPSSTITLYIMTEYVPTHYNDVQQKAQAFNTYFLQSGIGGKYQLLPGKLELEILYTDFWLGTEGNGAGKTYNFGVRIIR